jgi:hypothetical protein
MSVLDTKTKQPAERLDFDILYDDWLTPGDGITAANVTLLIEPDGELESPLHVTSDATLKVWLEGGINGTTYKVTITTETDDGRIKQDEFKVKVKDT